MGILNKIFKKKEKEVKEFTEKIAVTENVNEELLKVSKDYNLPISSLDFDILDVKTYIKTEEDTEFVLLDDESKVVVEDEKFLLNEENEIKQVYEIRIKKYIPKNGFEIIGDMKVNELYTEAEYIVFPNSDLKHFNEVKFYEEMNKKKVRNSLLINLLDSNLKDDIKSFANVLLEEKFEKPFHIRLCRGIDPIYSQEGDVIYHFKKNRKSVKKTLIYPIRKGDIIIEILKPKAGRHGRNCKGELIYVKPPKEFEIPKILFDDKSVEKREEEFRILYIAKANGYVVIEDDKIYVKDELAVKQINLKTGNVQEADKSDVKLEVKENSVLKEAIADDMVVETKELIVRGNVGNKAKVKAIKLEIDGQTHKNSIIVAKEAKLNVHKGKIKANNIHIKSLEGGQVRGKRVIVDIALGGRIVAEEVEINTLLSHTKIYALKSIKIKNQKGEENLLSINPKMVLDTHNIDELEKKVKEIEKQINFISKEAKKLKEIVEKNKSAYEDLKMLYLDNKKRGKQTSQTVIQKIKEYQLISKKYKNVMDNIKKLKDDKEELEEIIESLQNAVYNAKIVSLSPWRAFNRIEFDLLHPPIQVIYDTKGNEGICGFKLKDLGDEFKIVKIKVDDDSSS